MTLRSPGQAGLSVQAHGASDAGRVRDRNEDAFAVLPEQGLYIVADGIGGAAAGEVAGQIAVDALPRLLRERLCALRKTSVRQNVEAAVCEGLQEINDALVTAAQRRADVGTMGTTIVVALRWRASILIAHLGDSRAYLHRDGTLVRLTVDHALAAQLVRWGKLTESQAEDNPGRATLLRYLGGEGQLEPDFRWIAPQPSDRLLLCTDGLTGMLKDDEIEAVIDIAPDPARCCDALIARANEAGGKDNITVVVIGFTNPVRSMPPERSATGRQL